MSTSIASARPARNGREGNFAFPVIHTFPPFYTIQPNPQSRAQQLAQWRRLILDYCRHYRIFSLSATPQSSSPDDPHKTLFSNTEIQRSLSLESVRQVLNDLVANKQAAWQDAPTSGVGATKVTVYWKSPQEWADTIYEWVTSTGQNKSIMTMFELQQGELVEAQEFYNMPIALLRQALKILSTQGKAQIFAGTEADDGEGVKFV